MEFFFGDYIMAPIQEQDAWPLCNFVVANEDRLKNDFPITLRSNSTPTLSALFTAEKRKAFDQDLEYVFTIKPKDKREILGLLYVKELQKAPNQAELAYCIGYPYEGQGITSNFVSQISTWCFARLGVRTLQIITHKSNVGSMRIAKKNGFTWQCTLPKEHQRFNGDWEDMELYERTVGADL